jgi:hypothetical protein
MYKQATALEQNPAISMGYDLGNRVVNPRSDVEVLLRPLDPDGTAGEMELGLVMDSWTRGVADDSPWNPQVGRGRGGVARTPVPPHITLYYHDTILKKNLPNMSIMVACDPLAPSSVWGWCAYSPEVLHYVYVKSAFRRMGIGGSMIRDLLDNGIFSDSGQICCSHRTAGLFRAWPRVRWLWNPYKILGL